jgi:L-Ala-D/L-Glu epimerase
MRISISTEHPPFAEPFSVTGYTFTEANIIVVEVADGGHNGRGEAFGVYYHDETPATMTAHIESLAADLPSDFDRSMLQVLLPPGGARNALDCALWDLEAKQTGTPVWELAGLPEPKPVRTTITIGVDDPIAMATKAAALADALSIKVKLSGDGNDAARLRAIRQARPEVWLGVDANQGFDVSKLSALMPILIEANVSLIEQPFLLDRDSDLDGFHSPIFVAADESVQGFADIERLVGRFDVVNIKLDKCGGLTEGIAMARHAHSLGLRTMVGCMMGTVLSVAPAWLLAQICDYADLDAPLTFSEDRDPPTAYSDGLVSCPPAAWGNPS